MGCGGGAASRLFDGVLLSFDALVWELPRDELPRTRRWRSSPSSSLLSSSESKASARSGFTRFDRSRDDCLEWKDGGGEFGIGCDRREWSSSSFAFTCDVVSGDIDISIRSSRGRVERTRS
jgi:hypothetical protein